MKGLAIVLAAGLGTRMRSDVPKVLHEIGGKTIIEHVVDTLTALDEIEKVVVVISKYTEAVRNVFSENSKVLFSYQDKQLGTAHAFHAGLKAVDDFYDYVLVSAGDTPLITKETFNEVLQRHVRNKSDLTVVSFRAKDPGSYGRIKRDIQTQKPLVIVEKKDITSDELEIDEVNSGVYVFGKAAWSLTYEIKINKKKGEYYLTDILSLCNTAELNTDVFCTGDESEFVGINNRYDLMCAFLQMQKNMVYKWLEQGVTFLHSNSVILGHDVKIERDTIIYPNVAIEGKTSIGKGCTIRSNVSIKDSIIEDDVIIKENTVMEKALVKSGSQIGPFAHIRPNSTIGPKAKVGNFVEIKNSQLGYNTKASHLSYIGDADLGQDVNIGAGTITCNYDGKHKYKTTIEDRVFIGSDSQLIAPVTVEEGAFVAAGSTITKTVPKGALAISRPEQKNIDGAVSKIHSKGDK